MLEIIPYYRKVRLLHENSSIAINLPLLSHFQTRLFSFICDFIRVQIYIWSVINYILKKRIIFRESGPTIVGRLDAKLSNGYPSIYWAIYIIGQSYSKVLCHLFISALIAYIYIIDKLETWKVLDEDATMPLSYTETCLFVLIVVCIFFAHLMLGCFYCVVGEEADLPNQGDRRSDVS